MSLEAAEKEWIEILDWVRAEENRVTAQLKAAGLYVSGLDTNREAYRPIYEERDRRIAELKRKYAADLKLK